MAVHWTASAGPFWGIFPELIFCIFSEFQWKPWLPLTTGVKVQISKKYPIKSFRINEFE
jgi:hypothetical protein